ncbi:GtrA family protein [Demequina zhanjiangensis]|uniref:GtrA family protein n=1 Tax=Demequina zhanjiangensis TaxID=3051659 RepID=A0ABT8FXN4_9MICO|nr:GtrA family protein [Demequina sp. SYSU T00b26]MDN4471666.1 GtrA family protein [Demequina sp. SYSU T00b26]
MTVIDWVRSRAGELARFATVGAAGVVVNLGTFNLLRLGPFAPDAEVAGDDDRVVTAKAIATLVSIVFAWLAHRGWTFKGMSVLKPGMEALLFLVVNGAALLLESGTVALSHHVMGYTSALADNISAAFGIGLGTIARYAGYRLFLFHDPKSEPAEASAGSSSAD